MIDTCMGGLPTDSYSWNVGLIAAAKTAAKRIFLIVGGLMLIVRFFPKSGAVMTAIPKPVLGGATVTVFAAITMFGIQLIPEQPLNYRNKMILGIALSIGIGIEMTLRILRHPQLLKNLLGSSLAVSFLIALLLSLMVPKYDLPEE